MSQETSQEIHAGSPKVHQKVHQKIIDAETDEAENKI